MTNQEAADLLDNLIGMISDNQDSDYDEALKLGIEALKQKPCSDVLDYLETCYVGARAIDNEEECVRIARAIKAYEQEI